ncbi:MAG TPA: ribosome-associated translation inhibitor RaiA [Thermodesulfobacteriota bacterium]|nr:ribosome-associated translation inhibitor RaiA [Thermodesulfobacteriota bacterium]
MEISVTLRHVEPNDELKRYVEEKISRIKKFFDRGVKAEVVLAVEKRRFIAEANIIADGIKLNSKEASNENLFAAIDLVMDKLLNQASRYKSKLKKKKGASDFTIRHNIISRQKGSDTQSHKVINTEHYFVKPMTVEEAVMQLDLLKKDFLVFTNAQSHRVNVLYQRRDGNYGLIETESLTE